MENIVKVGKDLEEILESICSEYEVTKDDFYYKHEEKTSGLFNKNTEITVTAYLKNDILNCIKDYLQETLSNMGLNPNFETKLRDDVMYIKIYTENNSIIIGKDGNTLKSLEHITKQKIKNDFDVYPLINLDVENYKEKKEKRLEYMAKKLAKEVLKTKAPIELDNMNAYDRRIVHNALSEFKGISSESVGEEPNRHIVIKPL